MDSLQKLPPQNIEAEQMVLGAILVEQDSIKKITSILSSDDFYKESHRKIYKVLIEMFQNDEPIDLLTVTDKLLSSIGFESVGGASYLPMLVSLIPSAANIVSHAKIVVEKNSLRKLIHLAQDISTAVYSGDISSNDISHTAIQAAKNTRISSGIIIVKYDQIIKAGYDHIEKRFESKKKVFGVPTGIEELDDLTDGVYPGESWLVAARPGKGKTAFQMGVSRHAASLGINVGIINLEMGIEQLGIRSISSRSRIPISLLRKGMIEDRHWEPLTRAAGELSPLPIYVCSSAFNSDQIEHATDILVDDYGCQLIIYDYIQIIRPGSRVKDRNREQEVAEVSRMIKHKSMQPGARFAAMPLAQLNRETDKRKDKKPQMSDLRESGALENDADNIILIHHYECNCPWNLPCGCGNRNRVDFIIDKGRNSGTGVVEAVWDAFTTTFKSKTEHHQPQERNRYAD